MKHVLVLFAVFSILITATTVEARTLRKGTWSVSTMTFLDFGRKTIKADSGVETDTDYFNVDLNMGYFVAKNTEIGIGTGYNLNKVEDASSASLSYAIYTKYHHPLNRHASTFVGAWYGKENGELDAGPGNIDDETDGTWYRIGLGYEKFLTDNVALVGQLSWTKTDTDVTASGSKFSLESQDYGFTFGLNLFF